ncbi:conserved domain protein [Enterococcus faecalis TX1467]|nr:conserved domain protein [Enterococcus faecalis TX1467]
MDITDKEKLKKQMDFFKTHNFYQYVYQFRCLFVFIPVLGFFDLIFNDFSWLIIVKGILSMGILISEYYVMYRFFKPIALDEKQDFSSVQLFLNLFICNALFMFVMLTNFHQVFIEKEFIIFGSLIGSLVFGSFMGGIFMICLKEQLKEYQKLVNQFIDIKKEVH